MSPESIRQQIYSKKSNVWMFGIVGMDLIEISRIKNKIRNQLFFVWLFEID
jgi:hypothetical protein